MARAPGFYRGRHHTAQFFALQLISQILNLEEKPPITLALIALQSLLYYSPKTLHKFLRANNIRIPLQAFNTKQACLQPNIVLRQGQWRRILLATITHANDLHLIWNMSSFLSKGVILEPYFGTTGFLLLIIGLGLLSHLLYVGFALLMYRLFGLRKWMNTCVVGFSGVLFALKVVLSSGEFANMGYGRRRRVLGLFTVPSGQAHWAELVIAQVVNPRASFLGHLSGIFAGMLFVSGKKVFGRVKPLEILFESRTRLMDRNRFDFGSGTVGGSSPSSRLTRDD